MSYVLAAYYTQYILQSTVNEYCTACIGSAHDDVCTTTTKTRQQWKKGEEETESKRIGKIDFCRCVYNINAYFCFMCGTRADGRRNAPRRIWNFRVPGNNEQHGFYFGTTMASCLKTKRIVSNLSRGYLDNQRGRELKKKKKTLQRRHFLIYKN